MSERMANRIEHLVRAETLIKRAEAMYADWESGARQIWPDGSLCGAPDLATVLALAQVHATLGAME